MSKYLHVFRLGSWQLLVKHGKQFLSYAIRRGYFRGLE